MRFLISRNKKLFAVLTLLTLFHGFYAFALAGPNPGVNPDDGADIGIELTIDDVKDWLYGIACWLVSISLAVMIIALIVAGVKFFFPGKASDVSEGGKNILRIAVGIAVIIGINIIIATIANLLGADYSFLPFECP